MQIPYSVTSLDDLPEGLKEFAETNSLYKETQAGLVLDLNDQNDTRVAGLVTKKNELLAKVKQLQQKLDTLGDVDITEALHAVKELPKLQEQVKKGGKVDVEGVRAELKAEFDKQLGVVKSELDTMRATAQDNVQDNAINAAFDEHKVVNNPRTRQLLRTFLKSQLTTEEQRNDDGVRFIPRVKNPDSTTVPYRVSGNEEGDGFMTVGELLGGLREDKDFGFAFAGAQASGSGAGQEQGGGPSGEGQGNGKVQYREDLMTTKEQSDFITAHGSEAFLALPHKPA